MDETTSEFTWEVFLNNINAIKNLSDDLYDGWNLQSDNIEFGTYLSKRVVKEVAGEVISFDYHVFYNISYSAPGLGFNIYKMDGSLLELEGCLKYLNLDLKRDVRTMITQIDHPVLRRPFYTLHPCKTVKFIQESFPDSKNYVASWLSAMGPLIRLNFLNEYSKLT